jgi:hypothetical protein
MVALLLLQVEKCNILHPLLIMQEEEYGRNIDDAK